MRHVYFIQDCYHKVVGGTVFTNSELAIKSLKFSYHKRAGKWSISGNVLSFYDEEKNRYENYLLKCYDISDQVDHL